MFTLEQPPSASNNPDSAKNLEHFLSHEIPRQHKACVDSLHRVHLLEEIFSEQENELVIGIQEGITGMDAKKYELPSVKKISEHFSAEKYKEKIEQGFTKLLIVPFAYPIETLKIRYAEQLLKHCIEGKLFGRDNRHLMLDKNMPQYFSDICDHTDETGGLVYFPKQFDTKNHGGKTKQELLNDPTQPFPGFHVLLIKPDLTTPREGKGKQTGTRTDIEVGKSSKDYLKLLTESQYRHEQGFTIDDSIVLAMTHLDQTDRVIDADSPILNIGNFHPVSGDVPYSLWNSVRADVRETHPRSSGYGVRVAVA